MDRVQQEIDDIKVLIGICNNVSVIISREIEKILASDVDVQLRVNRLTELRESFLREAQHQFSRDNREQVRVFIDKYASQINRCVQSGTIPNFLNV